MVGQNSAPPRRKCCLVVSFVVFLGVASIGLRVFHDPEVIYNFTSLRAATKWLRGITPTHIMIGSNSSYKGPVSARSNTGNTYRLYTALNQKKAPSVIVLGGSLTTGADVGGKSFAWPAYLAKHQGWPTIANRAKGGTGSNYAVANLGTLLAPFDWDVVLLEFAVNDDDIGGRYSDGRAVSKTWEVLLRGIHQSCPGAAILAIECFRHRKGDYSGFDSGQNYHDMISKYYEIPVVSIREAIWPALYEAKQLRLSTPLTKAFPDSQGHPTIEGQQLIADLVSMELKRFKAERPILMRDRARSFPVYFDDNAGKADNAAQSNWLHAYNFEAKSLSKGVLSQKGWQYIVQYSRAGDPRPGMICNNSFPNELKLNVEGCTKRLQIGFLKTYERFGSATVNLGDFKRVFTLSSRWSRAQKSGTFTEDVILDNRTMGMTDASFSLVQTIDPDRRLFKLLYVRCE
jgi:hypothetical protein